MKIELTKTDTDFNDIRWIASALNRAKDAKPFSTRVRLQGSQFVATDGARLHLYEQDGGNTYNDGYYEVIKNTQSIIILLLDEEFEKNNFYPDVRDLCKPKDEVPEDVETVYYSEESSASGAFTTIIRMMKDNTLQYKFVDDVLKIGGEFKVWQVRQDPEQPVNFQNGNKFALVMPIRC